jgi:hypothetical protein
MAGVPQEMGYSSWRLPGPSSISTDAAYLSESTKMRKHQSVRARKQLQYSKDIDICRLHPSYFEEMSRFATLEAAKSGETPK